MSQTEKGKRKKKPWKNKGFRILEAVFYSFPVQLIILHLRKNQILLLCWLLLVLLVNQQFGKLLGVPYLFLDPEYLNEVGFSSFFIIGVALGGFTVAFHITCYILDGHKYNFIGILQRPFGKFSLNNSLIPLAVTIVYILAIIRFQGGSEFGGNWDILSRVLGLLSGMIGMITLLFFYFNNTNKDIFRFLTGSVDDVLKGVRISRANMMRRLREAKNKEFRVDSYFDYSFKIRSTKGLTEFYDKAAILKVFDQNHFNSALIESGAIALIIVLGMFVDVEIFQIPAAASVILILTLFIMLLGLFSYWTRGWSVTVAIALFLILNGLWKGGFLKRENEAYGLDYETEKIEYKQEVLSEFSSIERYGRDKLQTLGILENWKNKQTVRKPPAILACVSGGGQRAALWTFNALQHIDSVLNGDLTNRIISFTGASGGMIGAAYFRELQLRQIQGQDININESQYRENIAKDNLNPIVFSLLVNDIFLRKQAFEYGGHTYSKNRGYAFENQLNKNTHFVLDKPLADYRDPEAAAEIPLIILAPTIINDGRKLYISPQNMSYMTLANEAIDGSSNYRVTGVDFINFFKKQNSQNLRFLTGLRMSATFPYITPNIRLPSEPSIEIMDAGVSDNYGISDALRFLYVFRDWFASNTSRVIILSIRDTQKDSSIKPASNLSILQRIGAPVSSVYNNLGNIQDLNNDKSIGFAGTWFNGELHTIEIEYNTSSIFEGQEFLNLNRELQAKETERASLSWHLTGKEKQNIVSRIYIRENAEAIESLKNLVNKK